MNFLPETKGISVSTLISGCIDGRSESWDLFFQTFHKLVTGMVYHKSYAPKEDTIQNIYLRLIEEESKLLKKFTGKSYAEFLLFLKEICRNVIREENRKFKKKTLLVDVLEFQEETIVDPKSVLVENKEEEVDLILEKILELELGFREVMVLKLNGYKAREIAEILNIPLNTVLTRIKRSIEKIKKK